MYHITNGPATASTAGSHPPRTCAQLTNFVGAIMRQQMERHLNSRSSHNLKKQEICDARLPRSQIMLVEGRFETEI
jgi:hypothetical protein